MPAIVVIAPHQEISDIVNEIGLPDSEAGCVIARMEQGVLAARAAVEAGARVLVSRGLTYRMIVEALPLIPCVEIKVSGYDVLRAHSLAAKSSNRPAIVDRQEVVDGFISIETILQSDSPTVKVSLKGRQEVRAAVETAVRAGADCIVGNQAVVQEAQRRGLASLLVRSGQESVRTAMYTAQIILGRLRMQETNARQIDTIINAVEYGILAINTQGEVTAINTEARRLLQRGKEGGNHEAALIRKMLAVGQAGEKRTGLIEKFGPQSEIVINFHPIVSQNATVGLVATLQELRQLQDIEQITRRELVRRGRIAKHSFAEIQTQVPLMRRVVDDAIRFASYDSPLLILGETGVGKEYFAHAVHQASRRKNGPFLAVNCASIPESILESELFGHSEGAFTGSRRGGKMGLFEQAHGGTIFLDEIGEMLEQCQVRLLRVLQEYEVYRLGDNRTIPIDIRVIAATNRDLWSLVKNRKFREDLYYRLEALTIEVPPLRERKADIDMFVHYFINHYNRVYLGAVSDIETDALRLLKTYDWPGNIRELQNIVGRLVALAADSCITADEVRRCLRRRMNEEATPESGLRAAETAVIRQTLQETGGNKQLAANLLGISRATLWRKLKPDNE
jgi:transcriptional regulator with PAS, ATPase and Fis domain